MLNEQLQKQIEQEANKSASRLFNTHSRFIARTEYALGAERYADKWQESEEKAARYEKALEQIKNLATISNLSDGSVKGAQVLRIAREALTPKTSEDELHTKP